MRARITFALLFLIAFAGIASAAVCQKDDDFAACVAKLYKGVCVTSCDAKDWRSQWMALEAYCGTSSPPALCDEWKDRKASALTLDHPTQDWSASGGVTKRTKFDVNGKPEVALERGEHLIVVVKNTNPLIFGVELQTATREALPQIADLQALAKSLSGIIGMGLKSTSAQGESGDDAIAELTPPLVALHDAASKLECITDRTSRQTRQIVTFLQAMETGVAASYNPKPNSCEANGKACTAANDCGTGMACSADKCVDIYGLEYTNRVIGELEDAIEKLSKCGAVSKFGTALTKIDAEGFEAARTAFEQAAAGLDCSSFPIKKAREVLDELPASAKLVADAEKKVADAKAKVAVAKKAVNNASRRDKAALEADLKAAEAALEAAKEELKDAGDGLATVRKKTPELRAAGARLALTETALTEAETLLAKTGDLVNNVHQIVEFNARINEHALSGATTGSRSSGEIATFLVVPKVPDAVSWEEKETHPFKVVKTSPFADKVKTPRPVVDTSYKLIPASSRAWDVGVSVVRTRVADPTFAAIAAPGETEKKIAVKSEKTRSGELAMFLHLGAGLVFRDVPGYFRTAGLEIGTALSTDSPAFFAGVSVPLGRYLRLGYGYTAQRVTQLKSQKIGEPVADDAAIKTRKGFEDGHYISLSISVGAVRLFTKG